MKLLARANELQAAGHDVLQLHVGEPDFPTPAPIVAAAEQALRRGETKYTDARGIPLLREAIAAHYETRFGVRVSPSRIFVTAGASGGLLLLTALLLNPGENLLMTDPGYPCNRHLLTSFGAEAVLVPVDCHDGFQLGPRHVDDYWNENSRGLLLASPANPTGAVLGPDEFAALGEAVDTRGGVIIADEIYQGLTYEEDAACTILDRCPGAFVVNSFSKYFGMTGWRLGWVVVPDAVTTELEKLAQNLFICPSAIAQFAAVTAFEKVSLDIMENNREELRRRRDFLVPELKGLGFDLGLTPAGAFYVYAGLPDACPDAEVYCTRVLEERFVAMTPGTDFGRYRADRHLRLSYARDIDVLQKAVERIAGSLR